MYGLTHRLGGSELDSPDPAGSHRGTVLVVDRDPVTIQLARTAVAGAYDLLVASDADEAMPLLHAHVPDAVVIDLGLERSSFARVTDAIAADDHPAAAPLVMLDPAERVNAGEIRGRVDRAMRVSRRGYLGGGLRQRMAA